MRQIKRGHYKEDEFQSTMEKLMKYIVRHREQSIVIGVGVIAAVILVIFFVSRGEQTNPQADLLHTQALGLMSTGRIQEAEDVLTELTQQYGSTRAGKIGLYYLGVMTYHTGRFDESIDYFDEFLAAEKNDYLLRPSALMGAGNAAEGIKDYELAVKYYERLMRDEDAPLRIYGTLAYGRVLGLLGDTEKAREILQGLLDSDPPPPNDVAADARFYLGYFGE
ncbi:MAG: tetratricopeptide repeat protein [candidate division WOR-3 bacterium]|nr:MAG: tetratricopeptide repeat protein [candidate division WOR-3 bacterium]